MNVNLTPQLEEMIHQKVRSGLYSDASEVVQEALRLLDERDRMVQLRKAISVGDVQLSRGEVTEWTPDFMDRLKRESAEDERRGVPISDDVRPYP